jgi:hypothetical protein
VKWREKIDGGRREKREERREIRKRKRHQSHRSEKEGEKEERYEGVLAPSAAEASFIPSFEEGGDAACSVLQAGGRV